MNDVTHPEKAPGEVTITGLRFACERIEMRVAGKEIGKSEGPYARGDDATISFRAPSEGREQVKFFAVQEDGNEFGIHQQTVHFEDY